MIARRIQLVIALVLLAAWLLLLVVPALVMPVRTARLVKAAMRTGFRMNNDDTPRGD